MWDLHLHCWWIILWCFDYNRSLDETTFECQSFVLMIPSVSLVHFDKSFKSCIFRVSKCFSSRCKFLIRAEIPWNDTDNLIITYFALLCVSLSPLLISSWCFSHVTPLYPWARYVQVPRLLQLLRVARHPGHRHCQNWSLEVGCSILLFQITMMLLLQEKTEKSKVSCQWSRKQRNWIFGQKLWRLQRRLWLRVGGWHKGYQWTCQSRN